MSDDDIENCSNSECGNSEDSVISDTDESSNDQDQEQEQEQEDEAEPEGEDDEINYNRIEQKHRGMTWIGPPEPGQPDLRRSIRSMTRFERTRLISIRADMISRDDPPVHPKYQHALTDNPIDLAELEIDDPEIPFVLDLERPFDQPVKAHIGEVFNVRELLLPWQIELHSLTDRFIDSWTVRGQLKGILPAF